MVSSKSIAQGDELEGRFSADKAGRSDAQSACLVKQQRRQQTSSLSFWRLGDADTDTEWGSFAPVSKKGKKKKANAFTLDPEPEPAKEADPVDEWDSFATVGESYPLTPQYLPTGKRLAVLELAEVQAMASGFERALGRCPSRIAFAGQSTVWDFQLGLA